MRIQLIILFFSILLITSSIQSSWAEIFFPSTKVRLEGPSTYCIAIPTNELIESRSSDWIKLVEDSVLEWESNLKKAETGDASKWDMRTQVVSEEEENCDINIEFEDKPDLEDTVAGYFSWPPGKIVVYYLQPKICSGFIPCYDDTTLKSDEAIYAIVLHEMGHSLGLDHYVSDDNDVNKKWVSAKTSPPSVMIPTIPHDPSLLKVTDIDIQKVREIYGPNGFFGFSEETIPAPQPGFPKPPSEPLIPVTTIEALDISKKIIEVKSHDREIVTLSGKISEEEYHRGLPVIITLHKPDDSVEVLKITTTGTGYFETLLIFDKESPRGKYLTSASYNGHVDKNKDITFEVIDWKIDSSIEKTEPIFKSEDNSKSPEQIISNQEKIPSWIKNNAKWWANGQIEDRTFVLGIQHLVEHDIIKISNLQDVSKTSSEMPNWIKIIAGYWADDLIGEDEFIKSMQYLVSNGIIAIP